jgi:uncharacterized RDD family membrane protein YckC
LTVLAPWSRRILSFVVDQSVVAVPVIAVGVALGFDLAGDNSAASVWRLNVATAVWSLAYFTIPIGVWGRTLGKAITRTRVVALDGQRLGWMRAFQRALVPVAIGVIPAVGPFLYVGVYALAFQGGRRQGLHDRAAGSLVVAG